MTAPDAPAENRPGVLARFRALDPLIQLTAASLVGVVVINNDDPVVFLVSAITCLIALPRPTLLRNPWFWAAMFLFIAARQLSDWHTVDDHTIVMTYWCGALALGLGATDKQRTLATSARLLVGCVFAFAAGWKLFSGQFVDGTFFRFTLLFDDRFEVVSRVVGGTTDSIRASGIDAVNQVIDGKTMSAVVEEGPRNAALAQLFTWWGLIVETVVAGAFLAPLPRRWHWLRHASLLAFATTTYLVVPIGGFGTLLLVLAAATTTTQRARVNYYIGAAGFLVWAGVWPALFG